LNLTPRRASRIICRSEEIEILQGHIRPDHVHLLLSVPPHLAPSRVMQAINPESLASGEGRSIQRAVVQLTPACDHQIRCELDEATMLDLTQDIRSLSEFKRNTADLLDRLGETGHPLVLTINGRAELVVQDAAAYQALLDRVEAIEGIQQGLADVKAGRTKPARQAFARLRRRHGIRR
jgi:prevent-host-death family protein